MQQKDFKNQIWGMKYFCTSVLIPTTNVLKVFHDFIIH